MSDNWENFLNPNVIRLRFIRTGLFLFAHEMLMNSIKDRLHEFYADTWTENKGWKMSPAYQEAVLSLDPEGKKDITRSSIAWLRQNNVIDAIDELTIHKLTDQRNILAHELHTIIEGSYKFEFDRLFQQASDLIVKIDGWWIYHVELPIAPDFNHTSVGKEDISPGSSIILQILARISLDKEDEAWALYKEFHKNKN